MGKKTLPISLTLNFTINTLGCYELIDTPIKKSADYDGGQRTMDRRN